MRLHSTGDGSRLTALLLPQIDSIFSVEAALSAGRLTRLIDVPADMPEPALELSFLLQADGSTDEVGVCVGPMGFDPATCTRAASEYTFITNQNTPSSDPLVVDKARQPPARRPPDDLAAEGVSHSAVRGRQPASGRGEIQPGPGDGVRRQPSADAQIVDPYRPPPHQERGAVTGGVDGLITGGQEGAQGPLKARGGR